MLLDFRCSFSAYQLTILCLHFSIVFVTCHLSSLGVGYVHSNWHVAYAHDDGKSYALAWAVQLIPNASQVDRAIMNATSVASSLGLLNEGLIGHFDDRFLFVHPLSLAREISSRHLPGEEVFRQTKLYITSQLEMHPSVKWFQQEVFHSRVKRQIVFQDPMYKSQWHLKNSYEIGMDLNVTGLWSLNVTGKGVTVCVVDDGIEWSNKDLEANYFASGSWDLNNNDPDPSPEKDGSSKNEHGTRCAGEISAAANSFCGVGVAFGAKISGIKVLGGRMTDSLEATAFTKNIHLNDIYSCSWGPEDDGKTVDGPHHLSRLSLEHAVARGRRGYGTIYVVANGNGGSSGDNCNFDGYANSIYTITIGAVDERGTKPFYAEECACMLAVSFSSGDKGDRNIVTTDWTEVDGSGCTAQHTGTSAAAPLAAAIIALGLQVRPCLSWRDIQYLIILSSMKIDVLNSNWSVNAAGLHHSHQHGFGLLTAWEFVTAAQVWLSIPWMTTFTSGQISCYCKIPIIPESSSFSFEVTKEITQAFYIWIVEHAQVRITAAHPCRGRIEIRLFCPSGTESLLAAPRPKDRSNEGLIDWTFTTVRCWGESPIGNWTLSITDGGGEDSIGSGVLESWELILHGTPMTLSDFQRRKRLVEEAASGKFLMDHNFSLPCDHNLDRPSSDIDVISERTMKILALVGGFLFLLAVFETFEYLFCYNDEKKQFSDEASKRHRSSAHRHRSWPRGANAVSSEEGQSLLLDSDAASPLALFGREDNEIAPCTLLTTKIDGVEDER